MNERRTDMTKHLKDLMARGEVHRFRDEGRLDEFLDGERLSAEQRIAFKLEMLRTGRWRPQGPTLRAASLATDEAVTPGTMVTDRRRHTPETAPVGREIAALLRKAGLNLQERYTEADITEALDRSGLDVTEKIAVRAELYDRQRVRP
jgi:hypothetical protein